jgi:hypothetical protein
MTHEPVETANSIKRGSNGFRVPRVNERRLRTRGGRPTPKRGYALIMLAILLLFQSSEQANRAVKRLVVPGSNLDLVTRLSCTLLAFHWISPSEHGDGDHE